MSEKKSEPGAGKRKYVRYSEEFQKNAVRLLLENGFDTKKTAQQLGCSPGAISRWEDKYLDHPSPEFKALKDQAIEKLNKECDRLKKEIEILDAEADLLRNHPSEGWKW